MKIKIIDEEIFLNLYPWRESKDKRLKLAIYIIQILWVLSLLTITIIFYKYINNETHKYQLRSDYLIAELNRLKFAKLYKQKQKLYDNLIHTTKLKQKILINQHLFLITLQKIADTLPSNLQLDSLEKNGIDWTIQGIATDYNSISYFIKCMATRHLFKHIEIHNISNSINNLTVKFIIHANANAT